MSNPSIRLRAALDTRGITCLYEAIEAIEELQDLASWRPEVERALTWLHQAIEGLQVVERK